MSPIGLADLDSSSDGSEFQNEDEMSHDWTLKSTYPRNDGKWAIGDESNEPVAIVGIGLSKSRSLFTETVY